MVIRTGNSNDEILTIIDEIVTAACNSIEAEVSEEGSISLPDSQEATSSQEAALPSSPLSPFTDPGQLLDELEQEFDEHHSTSTEAKRKETDDNGPDSKKAKHSVASDVPPPEGPLFPPSVMSPMPEVWSDKRGGLCESLPYYNSYKSSLHSHNRIARGFLIDKEVDLRDILTAQVVICSM